VATPDDANPADRADAGYGARQGDPPIDCPVVMHLLQHDRTAEYYDANLNGGSACVELAQPGYPEVLRAIGCVRMGAPYFAEPVHLEADRCTDDGSTPTELRAVCIGEKGAIVHVQARRDGSTIVVAADGERPARWGPNACIAAGAFRFIIPETVPRFDAIRASWGRTGPSDRCATYRGPTRTVDAFLRELTPPTTDGGKTSECGQNCDEPLVELSIPSLGLRRELGTIGNGGGDYNIVDMPDVGGVALDSSNMGTSERFVFPMGDRLVYLTKQNATETVDLPCGTRVHFRVHARGERSKGAFLH
jgi:hypothetical protein